MFCVFAVFGCSVWDLGNRPPHSGKLRSDLLGAYNFEMNEMATVCIDD